MRKTTIKKSQAGFSWSQTDDSLSITLPVKGVTRKEVDVLFAEYVLKVNVPSQRYIQIIDFPFPIDFASSENRVQLTDSAMEVFLIKKDVNVAPWTELQLTGLSQAELRERRQRSLDDYYTWQEAEREKTRNKTYEMDHEAVRQHMAVESHQRDHIEKSKKAIHDRETDILQGELDAFEAQNRKHSDKARAMAYESQMTMEQKAEKYKRQKIEDIFGDADIQSLPRETSGTSNRQAPQV